MRRPISELNWKIGCGNSCSLGQQLARYDDGMRLRFKCQLGAILHVPLAKMGFRPLAPRAHEIVVQTSSDHRTGNWNNPARPLFDRLFAGLNRNSLNHLRHEAVDYFLFQQLAADINARCTSRGNPKLGRLMIGVVLKAVNEAELLDGAQSDSSKDAQVRQHRHKPTETESCSFCRGYPHAATDDVGRQII